MELCKISVVILRFYMNHNNAIVCKEMRLLAYLDSVFKVMSFKFLPENVSLSK